MWTVTQPFVMSVIEQVIFVGTGCSSNTPALKCLLENPPTCEVCLLALTEEGWKNRRKNPSVLVRVRDPRDPNGRLRNVLVDCGKTFYQSALDIFPRYGIREIDALILSHGHADAVLGLDDLRAWTSGGTLQESVPVYLNEETFAVVSRAFPYLVSKANATGGGEVASFQFTVIKENEPFEIAGLDITPLPVHHGKIMSTGEPYWCFGYRFGKQLSCITDANYIPPETFEKMKNSEILIVDCLREAPYMSHFGLDQALDVVKDLKARHNYLIGMAHNLEHEDLSQQLSVHAKDLDLHISPAYDTLKVNVMADGSVRESTWRE
ncbi:metallo-beta-lactamase family protein [Umbelopsis sp. AD052]|nr:metallo-beta-lactamase family protein [Umbelopsis sp. AD052]